jgi:hypothetical protein
MLGSQAAVSEAKYPCGLVFFRMTVIQVLQGLGTTPVRVPQLYFQRKQDKTNDKRIGWATGLLLQPCTFGFSGNEDRNVGVGVFPKSKKILIRRARFHGVSPQY